MLQYVLIVEILPILAFEQPLDRSRVAGRAIDDILATWCGNLELLAHGRSGATLRLIHRNDTHSVINLARLAAAAVVMTFVLFRPNLLVAGKLLDSLEHHQLRCLHLL